MGADNRFMIMYQEAGKLPRQWSEGEDHCREGPKGPRASLQVRGPEGTEGEPVGEPKFWELASLYYMFMSIQPKIPIFSFQFDELNILQIE